MRLALFHERPTASSEQHYQRFIKERVLERLREIDARVRRSGPGALDAADPLVAIGTEVNSSGKVTKNSYGVFNLAWQAQEHPEWPDRIAAEAREIRGRIRQAHQSRLRYLIWAGMGGSIEDKSMYNAAGLLKRNPACYALDSTDPAKLKWILEDIEKRSQEKLPAILRSTLIVGMAMGMTSYEPVVNLEKLSNLFDRHKIDGRPNFIYMTLPGSLLDKFAGERGYRNVPLQLDNDNSTAGRHSGPLTRGSLYPLALAGVDLRAWIEGTFLADDEIHTAWKLSAFLHAQGEAGRDKVTLLLPKEWVGAALWTKQDFEESLGKSEKIGLKILIQEKIKLANFHSPRSPEQDRIFLAVQIKRAVNAEAAKIASLRRAGYPVATLTALPETPLSRYMQFMHYVVCGLGYLRKMNFVTQPSVELYKSITNELHIEAQKSGGTENTRAWKEMMQSPRRWVWSGALTLYCNHAGLGPDAAATDAPSVYASILKQLQTSGQVEYGELTFFGDIRYSPRGRIVRRSMDRAAERVFRSRLKMPVDVYEGPAMNHSYHEMIIGHGKCFSTVLFSEKQDSLPAADYRATYHTAQFLATKLALEQRKRPVVAILLKDLSEKSIAALDEFFHQVEKKLLGARG